jgi:hypothetical protein
VDFGNFGMVSPNMKLNVPSHEYAVMEGVKFVKGELKPKKKAKSCTVKKVKV